MRKTFIILFAVLFVSAIRATATEYTTIEQLTSHYFVMSITDDGQSCTYYWLPTSNQNPAWEALSTVANGTGNYYLFKAEPVNVGGNTYYALRVYNKNKEAFTKGIEGGNALNPYTYGYFAGSCEASGKAHAYGSDSENNGLWTIEYSDGNGFAFKSASSNSSFQNKYLGIHGGKNDAATYWTCLDEEAFIESSTPANFTSVDELTANLFMLTAEYNGTEKKLVFQGTGYSWDVQFQAVNDAEYAFGGYYFKAEPVVVDAITYYALHIYGGDGSHSGYYNTYLGHYLNVNKDGFTNVFSGGLTNKSNGQDIVNGGLWTIVEGTGDNAGRFAFINAAATGDAKYLRIGHKSAGTEPCYFTARNRYSYITFYRSNTESDKYLSFSFPYDATISGAKVYTLSNVDSKDAPTKAYLEEVESGAVSAGKGYILKTENASDVTITVSDLNSFSKSTHSNGALVAVLYPERVPQNSYVLSGNKWLIADNETENNRPKASSTRAYLDLSKAVEGEPAGVKSFSLNFGEEETGILSMDNGQWTVHNAADAWYDLSGREIVKCKSLNRNLSKGLYIVNGKKVFIK